MAVIVAAEAEDLTVAAEVVASTVAGVVVSTVAVVEVVEQGASGLLAEVATAVAALEAEQGATTERAGVRTADLAHRVA